MFSELISVNVPPIIIILLIILVIDVLPRILVINRVHLILGILTSDGIDRRRVRCPTREHQH